MDTNAIFRVDRLGTLGNGDVSENITVIPAVYLNENTRITGGTGEEVNPFILSGI